MNKTYYVNGLCGSGKTQFAINEATRLVKLGKRVCIAAPSKALINEIARRFTNTSLRCKQFTSDDTQQVARSIEAHIAACNEPHLLLITHNALTAVLDNWVDARQWTLFVDEEIETIVDLKITSSWNGTQELWRRYFDDFTTFDGTQLRFKADVSPRGIARSLVAEDDIAAVNAVTRHLGNKNFVVSVEPEQWQRFNAEECKQLECVAMLDVKLFRKFHRVTFMGAAIDQSVMIAHLQKSGFKTEPAPGFTDVAYHPQAVIVRYGIHSKWSMNKYDKTYNGKTLLRHWMEAVQEDLNGENVLVHCNKGTEWPSPVNATKLPHRSEGLNGFQQTHNYAEAGAYNFPKQFIGRLERLGYNIAALTLARAMTHAYQGAMRTSLRTGEYNGNVIYVPSLEIARALKINFFPNAVIQRIAGAARFDALQKTTKAQKDIQREYRKRNRKPRKQAMTDAEKQKKYRERKRLAKLEP